MTVQKTITGTINIDMKVAIVSAQNGNQRALNKVMELAIPRIKKMCRIYNAFDHDEAVQETCVKIIKYLNSFDVEKADFLNWVAVITKNLVFEQFNKEKKRNTFSFSSFSNDYEFVFDRQNSMNEYHEYSLNQREHESEKYKKELLKEVYSIANTKLKEAQREAFIMNAKGFDHVEIAELRGVTVSTSKANLNRARVRIKNEILNK